MRLALNSDPQHPLVQDAIRKLRENQIDLCITPQSLRELWHVLTRISSANGAGLSTATSRSVIDELLKDFTLLDDTPIIFNEWLALVSENSISGAGCHDANHAASARVHGVDSVLTFDISDFNRFKTAGLTLIHPGSL